MSLKSLPVFLSPCMCVPVSVSGVRCVRCVRCVPVSVSACSRKVNCHRSVSIPPILEGDTDNWDEEEDSLELETKKQSRKR